MKTTPYDPALYAPSRSASLVAGPGAVDDRTAQEYWDRGFLAVADVFTPDEVAGYVEEIETLSSGKDKRISRVQEDPGVSPNDEAAASDRVRKLWLTSEEARTVDLPVDHPGLLAIVSRLMEDRAPRLYQTMALLKPPHGGGEKPWHQDHAYFNVPLGQRIVGVWIALDRATVANGCMQLLPGLHLDGPIPHFKRRDWQICDTEILGTESVAAELEPGGVLFFDALVPHGTPVNDSPLRRRALQLHYAPEDAPDWSDEQRMAVFGSEGRDVYC
ncbi:MAG: phytanoyl-CoA dioxygenase family protein [Planctomycetota bacterium]